MFEWRVTVSGVGVLGTVCESSEELARCAALSKYAEEGPRPKGDSAPDAHIYEDDDFNVARI